MAQGAADGGSAGDLLRLQASAAGLTQALKRVSDARGVDRAAIVRANEDRLSRAGRAASEGRADEARLLLQEAYLTAKLAIAELAKSAPAVERPAVTSAPPPQKSYEATLTSTKALRDALARLVQEKGDAHARTELSTIDAMVATAESEAAGGRREQAVAALDRPYIRAKVQIERLRGGETLVRSLHFASPAEEYHYEQDRNDTYRMLIPLLVPAGREPDPRLTAFVERAQALRQEADARAQGGDPEVALKLIEDSTKEYQKAIRNAGVLIPG